MGLRPLFGLAIGIVVSACGIGVVGTLADGPADARPQADDAPMGTQPEASSGGDTIVDDAAANLGEIPPVPIDLSGDAGPPRTYAVSGRFWAYIPTTNQWQGGTSLPSGGCPSLDELAIDGSGRLFGTNTGGTRLYRITPSPLSCSAVGPTGSFPRSLAFVPKGAVDPNAETLVGYAGNGDYVRIDTTTGAVTTVTAGALAGFSCGDLATSGTKGFVAVSGNGCQADCIWEIDLRTGTRVGQSPFVSVMTPQRITALAHWGGKLLAWTGDDTAYRIDLSSKSISSLPGPPGYFNVYYRGAASTPLAPSK